LEGNFLSLEQTDLVINEGQTISGKSARAFGSINHQEDCIYQNSIKRMSFLVKRRIVPCILSFYEVLPKRSR
jgi:hypothetical protein